MGTNEKGFGNSEFINSEIKKEAYFIHLHGINRGDAQKDWEDAEKLVKTRFRHQVKETAVGVAHGR